MSRSSRHPALYAVDHHSDEPGLREHFVPEGWEETDRGICPCGEAVIWNEAAQRWDPDRSLVVFVLTEAEAQHLRDDALMIEDLEPLLDLQLALNRYPDDEPDDGQVLIAGVLYDAETLEEAPPVNDVETTAAPVGSAPIAPMTELEIRARDGDR